MREIDRTADGPQGGPIVDVGVLYVRFPGRKVPHNRANHTAGSLTERLDEDIVCGYC
jgi:hypothetical protein